MILLPSKGGGTWNLGAEPPASPSSNGVFGGLGGGGGPEFAAELPARFLAGVGGVGPGW